MRVAVGSTNPVKVAAVKAAFASVFLEQIETIDVVALEVSSGIDAQPWSDDLTRQGSLNRAQAALEKYEEAHGKRPDYAVGIEGGVEEEDIAFVQEVQPTPAPLSSLPDDTVHCFAWLSVLRHPADADARWGLSRTATVMLPPKIVSLMKGDEKLELGDADDRVFSEVNSKQKGGTVVKLTNGVIDRTAYYEHAMTFALAPFLHDESGLYAPVAPPPAAAASEGASAVAKREPSEAEVILLSILELVRARVPNPNPGPRAAC